MAGGRGEDSQLRGYVTLFIVFALPGGRALIALPASFLPLVQGITNFLFFYLRCMLGAGGPEGQHRAWSFLCFALCAARATHPK